MRQAKRTEDMSPDGSLELIQEDDGDIIVIVREPSSDDEPALRASVQFCTGVGGGISHYTWLALVALLEAMGRDDRREPPTEDRHTYSCQKVAMARSPAGPFSCTCKHDALQEARTTLESIGCLRITGGRTCNEWREVGNDLLKFCVRCAWLDRYKKVA